jgi:hypothetical protein
MRLLGLYFLGRRSKPSQNSPSEQIYINAVAMITEKKQKRKQGQRIEVWLVGTDFARSWIDVRRMETRERGICVAMND